MTVWNYMDFNKFICNAWFKGETYWYC